MGIVDDYLSSLEGKENLNPLEVARKLHELHNEEIGTREAKITELEGSIAEKDAAIATVNKELTTQKAKNFDLAMQIPGAPNQNDNQVRDENEKPDSANIRVSDLFNTSVRKTNPHFRNERNR